MKSIIEFAKEYKITNGKNSLINKSLDAEIKEDRVIRIITKEVTDFILNLFENKNNKV
jgi:hypothetical protein